MFKMDLILENSMAQIHLNSYLLRGKWSTVAVPFLYREDTCPQFSPNLVDSTPFKPLS